MGFSKRALVALLLAFTRATALRLHGKSLDTMSPWVFLERFCFVPTPKGNDNGPDKKFGFFEFEVEFPRGSTPLMLLYFSGFSEWRNVYNNDRTCSQRRQEATEVIDLTTVYGFVDSVEHDDYNRTAGKTKTKGGVYFTTTKSTWFFIVLANCESECLRDEGYQNCQGPVVVDYDFDLTNGALTTDKQFSADEIGTLPLVWFFFSAYACLSIFCINLRSRLKLRRKYHHTVAMLCWAVWVAALGTTLALIHYSSFSKNGVGSPAARAVAQFLWQGADLTMLMLLILLAKGWTIVRRKISINGRVRIAVYITFMAWCTILLELWALFVFDRAILASRHESPPGIVLVSLRFVALIWFAYACSTTMKKYRSKIHFYRKFSFVFTWWLVAKPVVAIIAIFVVANQRAIFQLGCDLTLLFLAQFILAMMYYPDARCNKSFPFHANSSSALGIMGDITGAAGRSAEGDYDSLDIRRDEDAGVDIDSGRQLTNTGNLNYAVSRQSIFRRISTAGGKTARLMRTMAKISTDLDRALLDLQGEIEGDLDHDNND